MRKKKDMLPPPYASETKDARHAGTFEVLIPVEGRNKPLRAPRQFGTMQAAEAWLHYARRQGPDRRPYRGRGKAAREVVLFVIARDFGP